MGPSISKRSQLKKCPVCLADNSNELAIGRMIKCFKCKNKFPVKALITLDMKKPACTQTPDTDSYSNDELVLFSLNCVVSLIIIIPFVYQITPSVKGPIFLIGIIGFGLLLKIFREAIGERLKISNFKNMYVLFLFESAVLSRIYFGFKAGMGDFTILFYSIFLGALYLGLENVNSLNRRDGSSCSTSSCSSGCGGGCGGCGG